MNTLKQEWDAIDAAEGALDDRKWKLAERLAAEQEAGRTLADLANEVERAHQTVSEWIKAHRTFCGAGPAKPESFNKALEELRGRTPESERIRKDESAARKVLRERPEVVAEEIAKAPPEKRQEAFGKIAAASDEETRDEMVEAVIKAEPPKQRKKPERPAKTWMGLWKSIDDSLRKMKFGLEELKDQPRWPDEIRDALLDRLRRMRDTADFMIGYIESGDEVVSDIEDYLTILAEAEEDGEGSEV